jgi:hypothetical protein
VSGVTGRIDHVVSAERMIRELLLVCPDPNDPDFETEGRREEFRINIAARAMLAEAMEIIEIASAARALQTEREGGTLDPVAEGIMSGQRIGEEVAAKRTISRFVGTFDAH